MPISPVIIFPIIFLGNATFIVIMGVLIVSFIIFAAFIFWLWYYIKTSM